MNREIKKILAFAFIIMIMLNLAHPSTPALIKNRFNDFGMFGYMFSAMAAGSFFAARYIGKLWDKHHNKYILLIPFATIYPLAQFLMAIAPSKTIILLARFLSGVGGAAVYFVIFPAMISDWSNAFDRSKNQLYFTITYAISAQIGYLIGGYLGNIAGPEMAIKIQALFGVLSVIPGYFLINNGIKHKSNFGKVNLSKEMPDPEFKLNCDCNIFWTHKLYHFLFMIVPMFFIFAPLGKFFDVTLSDNGFNPSQIGLIALLNGVVSLLFTFFVGRKLLKKYNEINPLTIVAIIMMVILLIIGTIKKVNILIWLFPIWWSLQTVSRSLIVAIVSKHFRTHAGSAMGLRSKFNDFGAILGSLIMGWIFAKFPWGIYLFSGLILIPTSILLIIHRKHLIKNLGGRHWW